MFKMLSWIVGVFLLCALVFFAWRVPPNNLDQFRQTWFQELSHDAPSTGSVSLQSVLLEKKSSELSDLGFSLPHYHLYPGDEIRALNNATITCHMDWKRPFSKELIKAWQWAKHTCKQGNLPADFFSTKPFLHPSGQSYVFLNETSPAPVALSSPEQRRSLMSLVESLQEGDELQKYLAVNLLPLEKILAENPLVTSEDWVFVRDPRDDTSKKYLAFPRAGWDGFFAKQPFNFESSPSGFCVEQYSEGCWVKNQRIDEQQARWVRLLIVFLIAIVGGVILWSYRRHARLKKTEEEQRRFALQMLTHELRTPVTSLLLLVENMRSQFDLLPDESQKDFMKLIDEVRRLQRTTESSEIYLKMEHSSKDEGQESFLALSLMKKLEQIHQFESVIYEKDLQLFGKAELMEFCLSNLLRNAHRHGKGPVTLSILRDSQDWVLEVKDEGSSPTVTLQELAQPFYRSERSQGLGLGLSLVAQICKQNGWKFLLNTHPTRFSIHVPRARGERPS